MTEVFIGGSGRSGTSFLHRMVRTSPGFAGVEAELKFLIEAGGLLDLFNAHSLNFNISRSAQVDRQFPAVVERAVGQADWGAGIVDAARDLVSVLTWPSGVGRALARDGALVPLREFARRVRSSIAGEDETTVFVEKTPHNSLHAEWLRQLFDDPLFVNIVRDPRGVVWSLREQAWAPDTTQGCIEWLTSYFDGLELAEASMTPEGKQRTLTLTLEELVAEPARVGSRLAHHLGRPVEITAVDRDVAMRWEREMPQADQEAVWQALGDRHVLYGYTF